MYKACRRTPLGDCAHVQEHRLRVNVLSPEDQFDKKDLACFQALFSCTAVPPVRNCLLVAPSARAIPSARNTARTVRCRPVCCRGHRLWSSARTAKRLFACWVQRLLLNWKTPLRAGAPCKSQGLRQWPASRPRKTWRCHTKMSQVMCLPRPRNVWAICSEPQNG